MSGPVSLVPLYPAQSSELDNAIKSANATNDTHTPMVSSNYPSMFDDYQNSNTESSISVSEFFENGKSNTENQANETTVNYVRDEVIQNFMNCETGNGTNDDDKSSSKRKLGETDDNEIEGIAKYQKLSANQVLIENDGKESCNYQNSEVQQPYLDESEIERSEQTIESLGLPESSDNPF